MALLSFRTESSITSVFSMLYLIGDVVRASFTEWIRRGRPGRTAQAFHEKSGLVVAINDGIAY